MRMTACARNLDLLLALLVLGTLLSPHSQAKETDPFYFDAKSGRHFTSGKVSFSLFPTTENRQSERFDVSIDDGPFSSFNGTLTLDKEGPHRLRFRATDPLLNWSPIQDALVYVDRTPPTTKSVWSGPNQQINGILHVAPTAQLSFVAADAASGVSQTFTASSEKALKTNGPLSFKDPGPHSIKFWSVDNTGNQESPQELKFIVDATAPTTTATLEGSSYQSKNTLYVAPTVQVSLTATDDASGVANTEVQIGTQGPILYSGPFGLSEKKSEIKYRSSDFMYNKEPWKTLSVTIDSRSPRLSVAPEGKFLPISGKLFALPGFSLLVTASDDESGLAPLQFSINGNPPQPVISNRIPFALPGEMRVIVIAKDNVGNVTTSDPLTIIIDAEGPSSSIRLSSRLTVKDEIIYSSIPNKIELIAEDSASGTDYIETSYDGKTFVRQITPIDVTKWNSSEKTLFYRAVDRLGNKELPHRAKIILNSNGPKIDLAIETKENPNVPLSVLRKGGTNK